LVNFSGWQAVVGLAPTSAVESTCLVGDQRGRSRARDLPALAATHDAPITRTVNPNGSRITLRDANDQLTVTEMGALQSLAGFASDGTCDLVQSQIL
jgi:hypothetical protein